MPYIKRTDRQTLWNKAAVQIIPTCETAGELNYWFTETIQEFLGKAPNYQKFNDVMGALESCKLELYARKVRPYEDKKILENGDIY